MRDVNMSYVNIDSGLFFKFRTVYSADYSLSCYLNFLNPLASDYSYVVKSFVKQY